MSVINQMLKDLDKRQAGTPQLGGVSVPVSQPKSSIHWVYIVIALLVINGLGWYIWTLNTENHSLKQANNSRTPAKHSQTPADAIGSLEVTSENKASLSNIKSEAPVIRVPSFEEHRKKYSSAYTETESDAIADEDGDIDQYIDQATNPKENGVNKQLPSKQSRSSNSTEKPEVEESTARSTDTRQDEAPKQVIEPETPALSISRRELTPEEFVAAKLEFAEKSVERNELAKAEKAFEEVLLVSPTQKVARKQLAALWFGRQLYQPAINLLAQGLSLDDSDIDMRMMQARIYLAQGDMQQALNILKVKSDTANKDYQALVAATAQQLGDNQTALAAYHQLTLIEPQTGRWWLGMAIAFDRSTEYEKAKQAYQMAIAQRGLSAESLAFAQQRLSELGE